MHRVRAQLRAQRSPGAAHEAPPAEEQVRTKERSAQIGLQLQINYITIQRTLVKLTTQRAVCLVNGYNYYKVNRNLNTN